MITIRSPWNEKREIQRRHKMKNKTQRERKQYHEKRE